MTLMEQVKKIEADIAALPVDYRALLQKEQVWSEAHPWLYAAGLMTAGALALQIVIKVFGG